MEAAHRVSLEANLSTEVGIIVLDLIAVYVNKFKEKLEDNGGDNTKVGCLHVGIFSGLWRRKD